MGSLIRHFVNGYNDLMEKRDPRTDGWLFMSSPFPTLFIVSCYIYFVKSLGPRLMKDRPAFDLKSVIIVYNICQVFFSSFIVYKGLKHAWLFRYSWICQPMDYSDNPDELIVANLSWWYWFSKFFEFLDTVFFVLRKKYDQITTLHVVHHSVMSAGAWWGMKFVPGGHATFFGLLNSFVHVVMYSYYLLAAMGPKYQKYLWWKKHLTTMQMIQFGAVFIHSAQALYFDCNFPRVFLYLKCSFSVLFFSLFFNFYIQAYIKRSRLPAVAKTIADSSQNVTGSSTNGTKRKLLEADVDTVSNSTAESFNSVKQRIVNLINESTQVCYVDHNGLYKGKNAIIKKIE